MEVESLVKMTVDEIQKVLTGTTVIAEPRTYEGVTLIPLQSTGFLFAAGGGGAGKGESSSKAEGQGGGSIGGGGVKPVAVVIIDKTGVRVEGMKGGLATVAEKLVEKAPEVVGQVMTAKSKGQEKQG